MHGLAWNNALYSATLILSYFIITEFLMKSASHLKTLAFVSVRKEQCLARMILL